MHAIKLSVCLVIAIVFTPIAARTADIADCYSLDEFYDMVDQEGRVPCDLDVSIALKRISPTQPLSQITYSDQSFMVEQYGFHWSILTLGIPRLNDEQLASEAEYWLSHAQVARVNVSELHISEFGQLELDRYSGIALHRYSGELSKLRLRIYLIWLDIFERDILRVLIDGETPTVDSFLSLRVSDLSFLPPNLEVDGMEGDLLAIRCFIRLDVPRISPQAISSSAQFRHCVEFDDTGWPKLVTEE